MHAQAKVIYGAIQFCPTFVDQHANTDVEQLARFTGLHPATVRRALHALTGSGWVEIQRLRRTGPFIVLVRNPQLIAQLRMIAAIDA